MENSPKQIAGIEQVAQSRCPEEREHVNARPEMATLPGKPIGVEQYVEGNALAVGRADNGSSASAHENLGPDAELLAGFQHTEVGDTASCASRTNERDLRLGVKHASDRRRLASGCTCRVHPKPPTSV